MAYPYNGQLAPAVGRSLPGLPNRDLALASASSVPNLFVPSGQTSSFPYLMPVGTPLNLGASSSNKNIIPLLGSNKYLTYDGAAVTYRVANYGATGISNVVTTSASNATTATAATWFSSMLPISATRVVGVTATNAVGSLIINGAGNVTEVNNFISVPTSGTLMSGETYTAAALVMRSGAGASGYNILPGRNGTIHLFGMGLVSGVLCVMLWEYDTTGTLLGVYKLFTQPAANPLSWTLRRLEVFKRGVWYHCVAQDMGPSPPYTSNVQYVAVDTSSPLMGASVVVAARNTGAVTMTASEFLVVRCAPRGMLVLFAANTSNTVMPAMSFMAPIAANGAPMPVVAATGGTTTTVVASDTTFAGHIMYAQYNAFFDMWSPAHAGQYPVGSVAQSHGAFASKLDVTQVNATFAPTTRQMTKCVASPVSITNQMVFNIVNAAQVVDQTYAPGVTASQIVQALTPLENGYWLGSIYNEGTTYAYQLYSEVTL